MKLSKYIFFLQVNYLLQNLLKKKLQKPAPDITLYTIPNAIYYYLKVSTYLHICNQIMNQPIFSIYVITSSNNKNKIAIFTFCYFLKQI